MTARKIRMTAVGLIAMPADRDEATVTAAGLPTDHEDAALAMLPGGAS